MQWREEKIKRESRCLRGERCAFMEFQFHSPRIIWRYNSMEFDEYAVSLNFYQNIVQKKTLESLEICHIEHSNDKWNQNPINEFVRKCCELIVLIFSLHYSNILCSFDGFSSISSSSFYARYAVAYSSNHNSTFCCIHCHIYICCALCR